MTRLRTVWTKLWGSYSIGLAVLIVGVVLALLTPNFLRPDNLLNVLANASIVGIVGLGMTLAIAAGMFDLSVGSTAAFAGCVTLSLVPELWRAAQRAGRIGVRRADRACAMG